ncbi:MAG: outer membrane protein assembly factor BamA [Planctomycetota bacterium]
MLNKNKLFKYRLVISALFLLIIFLGLLPAQTPPAAPPDQTAPGQKIIKEIKVVGLKRTNPQLVLNKIQTKENTALDQLTIEEDIRRLYATGLFANITTQTTALTNGDWQLTFTFQESESVENLVVDGLKSLDLKTLSENFKTTANGSFDTFFIKQDLDLIKNEYLKKGYHFAEVNHRTEEGLKGKLVYYLVQEGPKVKIKKISFAGNDHFPSKRHFLLFSKHPLMNMIKTRISHWYATSVYNEQELMMDLERLKTFYRNEGFPDIDAFVSDVLFNETKTSAEILIQVKEGPLYHVQEVKIEGNAVLTTTAIAEKLKLKPGSPYVSGTIRSDTKTMMGLYGQLGYIDCDIDVRTHFPTEPALVNVTYHIKEGNPKQLKKINIAGNDKTKDKTIRQRLTLYPGELVDYDKIRLSYDRLAATRYFEELGSDIEDADEPNYKNITFKVKEGQTGILRIGGGFSSNSGFGGTLEIQQNNFDIGRWPSGLGDLFGGHAFAGGGQQFNASWQPGRLQSRSGVSFREPYFLDRPIELGFKYFKFNRAWSDYDERRKGGSISVAHRFLNSTLELGLSPRTETIKLSNLSSNAPATIVGLQGTNRIHGLGASISWDKRNRWVTPSKGYELSLNYEYAGGELGGDFDFLKTYFKGKQYFTLASLQNSQIILSLEGKLGVVKEFADSSTVPVFERFYAGGINSVRGFEYRTISPRENGIEVGGKVLTVFNAEISFPLYTQEVQERPMDMIRGLLFFDVGNVVNKWDNVEWDTVRTSLGAGIRFYLMMLPIEISLARPIKKEDGDDLERIQLNFGFNY